LLYDKTEEHRVGLRTAVAPDRTTAAPVVVVIGDAVVGQALELLLQTADFSTRFLAERHLDEPGSLDGVRLLLLAPGLGEERREALLRLVYNNSSAVKVPVLELIYNSRVSWAGKTNGVAWPCRAEALGQRIRAALLGVLAADQDGPGTGQEVLDPQALQEEEEWVDDDQDID